MLALKRDGREFPNPVYKWENLRILYSGVRPSLFAVPRDTIYKEFVSPLAEGFAPDLSANDGPFKAPGGPATPMLHSYKIKRSKTWIPP